MKDWANLQVTFQLADGGYKNRRSIIASRKRKRNARNSFGGSQSRAILWLLAVGILGQMAEVKNNQRPFKASAG